MPMQLEPMWEDVELADVKELIAQVPEGTYTTKSLYDAYCEIVQKGGRKPGAVHTFGKVLSSLGAKPRRNAYVRGWTITHT